MDINIYSFDLRKRGTIVWNDIVFKENHKERGKGKYINYSLGTYTKHFVPELNYNL